MLLKTLSSLLLLVTSVVAQSLELREVQIDAGALTFAAEIGKLPVPQLYDEPDAGQLQVAVCVLRSTAESPAPPVFFLNGLPGGATSVRDDPRWAPFLAMGDVVFMDQRGTGNSEPTLFWTDAPLQAERLFGNPADSEAHALETARAVREFMTARGVSVNAFTTRQSARDIESVRVALGYSTIRLMGHSSGTQLGLHYLREYPAHVDRFVSIGTAGPNDIHSLPSELDKSLRRISDMVRDDPRIGEQMPDFYERVEKVLDQLEAEPLELELMRSDREGAVTFHFGRHGLQFLLLLDLGDPRDFIVFPRLIHELERGEVDTLVWFLAKRYRMLSKWPAVMFISRGAAGATESRWAEIRRQAQVSPFGLARCNFSPAIDKAFGVEDLGDDFRADVESDVPTLFISGSLDANTPPFRAEQVMRGFSEATHLILENGGHETILRHDDVHEAIHDFLAGRDVEGRELVTEAPRFALLEGSDRLVDHDSLP